MKTKIKVATMTKIAILSAIAIILQYLVPVKIKFLEVEFSDFPAIIAALALGPWSGVLVELLKNLIHIAISTTGYVGELANFLVNGTFVLVIGIIYKYDKTKITALLALLCGTVVMTGAAMLSNRFLTLPLYGPMVGIPKEQYWVLVFTLITPFNFIRGLLLSAITFFSYKKLRVLLK